jgi:hypothetical protein
MNTVERIAELEKMVHATQAEIVALKAERPAPVDQAPQRPVDPDRNRPLVTILAEQTKFIKPTGSELRKIYNVVLKAYPQLGPHKSVAHAWTSVSEAEHYAGYASSFERLGFIGRTAQPDTRRYLGHWTSECRDWLARHRPRGYYGNVGAGYLCAVLAHGDIPFIAADPAQGVVWSVGLTTFGGAMAGTAWKRVLDGQILAPTPARRYA